jgi:mono/diheme cytochrome c family protein
MKASAHRVIAIFTLVAATMPATIGSIQAAGGPQPPVSFKEDVQPVLREHCTACHSPNGEGTKASGLDLTSYAGVMAGTRFGPMIVPGDPDVSNLMRLLDWRVSPQIRMPHGKKQLSTCDRDSIRSWIRQGAKDN